MNFKYLDDLIHCGEDEIVLDSDIVLDNAEEMEYFEGINLDVDDIVIDGNGFAIDAAGKTRVFLCTAENVCIRNIVLKNGFCRQSGGAVLIEEGEALFCDVKFEFNKSLEDGGAVHNDEGNLVLSKCEFYGNKAGEFGGALNNWGELKIVESKFKDNKANYAGAIFNAGDLTVEKSSFIDNSADNGGVIYNEDGDLAISESRFIGNISVGKGGAVVNKNCDMSVIRSFFESNRADKGGAVYSGGEVSIVESVFNGNSAIDGGAIYGDRVDLSIKESEFNSNVASSNGGALYNYDGELSLLKSAFFKNVADCGGAVKNEKSVMDIDEVSFRENAPDDVVE